MGDEEAAEFVEPQGAVYRVGRVGELLGCCAGNGLGAGRGVVVVEGREVFLELEGRVDLLVGGREGGTLAVGQSAIHSTYARQAERTSFKGMNGGPAAISHALVPGWMRRFDFSSCCMTSASETCRLATMPGDAGPI